MNRAGLIELIAVSDLPAALRGYLGGVLARNLPSTLREVLKKDPAGFMTAAAALLRDAGEALGCGGGQALLLSGFDGNNLAPDRLESALAELLAAVYLRSCGFSGLGFIGRGAGKTADISASREGLDYVFEVCSSRTAGGALSLDLLEHKYDKKIRQARVSAKKKGPARAGFLLVAGPPFFSGFLPDRALAALASGLYERKNRPPATHICLLAGGCAAVFPDWGA